MARAGAFAPPPESDLLRRIGARDEQAVAELYERVAGALFRVAHRILDDRADAEDVVQDVFLQVWIQAERYDPAFGAPLSWLARIARNRAIDRRRVRQVRAHLHHQPLEAASEFASRVSDANPQRLVEVVDAVSRVSRAMDVLPLEQRTLIEHAFFEGFTHTELADRFGLPLGTVKTRIRAGVLALRQDLVGVRGTRAVPGA